MIILEIVAYVIGLLGAALGVFRYFHNRIYVKRIYTTKDKKGNDNQDFNKFSVLFENKIRWNLREVPEDIGAWLDEYHENKNTSSIGEYLLITKSKQKVIGFLFFEYSFKTNFMYIAFLGGPQKDDDEENYRDVTTRLVKKCCTILEKELKDCKLIIFEVDDENDVSLEPELQKAAEAKKRIFRRQVKKNASFTRYGAELFEIMIDYYQPPLHRNHDQRIKQDLLIIPLDGRVVPGNTSIRKEQLIEILDFLFFEIYDPLSDDQFLGREYHILLQNEYETLVKETPDIIDLHKLS